MYSNSTKEEDRAVLERHTQKDGQYKRYSTTKLYNDQRNAQVFNLFIYLLLPCFGVSFSQSSEAGVQVRQWL
jgi:hypothetical protein